MNSSSGFYLLFLGGLAFPQYSPAYGNRFFVGGKYEGETVAVGVEW